MINAEKFKKITTSFSSIKPILVIGDIGIDKYTKGHVKRISPEAPVPVVTYIEEKETRGGAGLVYENLKNLGVDVDMFETDGQVSVKTRIICDGHYVTRIDDDAQANGTEVLKQVQETNFSQYDYVVLSDYNKGVLDEAREIIKIISNQIQSIKGIFLIIDFNSHLTKQ